VKVSRSAFLRLCGAAALGHGVSAAPWDNAFPPANDACLLSEASAARFRLYVNTTFTIRSVPGSAVPLVLAHVIDGPGAPGVQQFSLIFHGPADAALAHGTHTLRHRSLGTMELFISPVGESSARRTAYEACFSRHVAPEEADACRMSS